MKAMEGGVKLVLIDDDEGVLRALGMLLQALGFEVHSFSSAKDALTCALETASVDLIVSDLRMPGFSGEDVVREVRARGSRLPIIVMSGHATATDIEALRSLGMNAFVSKPFTPDTFVETVRRVLGTGSSKNAA
jgi:two-component system response regulator FixJ